MNGPGAFSLRLAGMMRNFYCYCVSLVYGGGGGGGDGRSPAAGCHRRRLRGVTIRSIGGYEVVSFRDEPPPPPPLLSSANSSRTVDRSGGRRVPDGHRRRRAAKAEATQPTASFRLMNRLSKDFVECSGGRVCAGSYGRNKERRCREVLEENVDVRFGGDRRGRGEIGKSDENRRIERHKILTPDSSGKDLQMVGVGHRHRGGEASGNRDLGGETSGNRDRGGEASGNRERGGEASGNQGRGREASGNRDRGREASGNRDRGDRRSSRFAEVHSSKNSGIEKEDISTSGAGVRDLQRLEHGDDSRVAVGAKWSRSESCGSRSGNQDSAAGKDSLKVAGRQLRLVRQEEWMLQMSAKSARKVALSRHQTGAQQLA